MTAFSRRIFSCHSFALFVCCLGVGVPRAGAALSDLDAKSMQYEGIYYFALSRPNRIERFDLLTDEWLSPIPLTSPPTSLWVDGSGVFVAQGAKIHLVAPEGSPLLLAEAEGVVDGLYSTADGYLVGIVGDSGSYTVISGDNPEEVHTYQRSERLTGVSIARGTNTAFANTIFVAPTDIVRIEIDPGAAGVSVTDSPLHGDTPTARRTFPFPDGLRVADDAGTVFHTADLTLSGTLGEPLVDIDFVGEDIPVVLRGGRVTAYDSVFNPTGSIDVPADAARLAVRSDDLVVFSQDGSSAHSIHVEHFPLAPLRLSTPGLPKNPVGLEFVPDEAFLDRDGTLLLLSKAHSSLFRWSIAERRYIGTIPLDGPPVSAAYAAQTHRMFFGYPDGSVTRVDLARGDQSREDPFAALEHAPLPLFAIDDQLLARSGGYHLLSANGEPVATTPETGGDIPYGWSEATRTLFEGPELRARLIDGEDAIGNQLPGGDPDRRRLTKPLSVSPTGLRLVCEHGLYDAHSLYSLAPLPPGYASAFWSGDNEFVMARTEDGLTVVETYAGPPLERTRTATFDGTPVGIFDNGDNGVLVSVAGGIPRITEFDKRSLSPLFASPAPPARPGGLGIGGRGHQWIEVTWDDRSDSAVGFAVEHRSVGAAAWTRSTVVLGETHSRVEGLPAGTELEFRVLAINAEGESAPSDILATKTLDHPDSPPGMAEAVFAERVFIDLVQIAWRDGADGETGYRVFKTTDPALPLSSWQTFDLPADSTRFSDGEVVADEGYYYRVAVVAGARAGDLSPLLGVGTPREAYGASSPRLTLEATAPDTVLLTWEDRSLNEDGFIVTRSTSPDVGGAGVEIGRLGFNETRFTDIGLEPDTQYYYRVSPYNALGTSSGGNSEITTPRTFTGLSAKGDGVYYFAFESPNRLERYDLAGGEWLEPWPLWGAPSALTANAHGLFVGRVGSVVEVLEGGAERHVLDFGARFQFRSVHEILVMGGGLVVARTPDGFVTGLLDGRPRVDGFGTFRSARGIVAPPGRNRFFGVEESGAGARVGWYELYADGRRGTGFMSTHFAGHTASDEAYMYPDGSRFITSNGAVFGTGDVEEIEIEAELGAVLDVDFVGGDIPIVLKEGSVEAYDQRHAMTGRIAVDPAAARIAVWGQELVTFHGDAAAESGIRVGRLAAADLNLAPPTDLDQPIDLKLTIDQMFVGHDGTALLYSSAYGRLFRWRHGEGFLPSIPLRGYLDDISYSPELNQLYMLSRGDGCYAIDLDHPEVGERLFADLPVRVIGIEAAGEHLLAQWNDETGIRIYDVNGMLTGARGGEASQLQLVWRPATRTFVRFGTGASYGSLVSFGIGADGSIGPDEAGPTLPVAPRYPLRTQPDGDGIAVGSGTVFGGGSPRPIGELRRIVDDITWLGDQPLTAEAIDDGGTTKLTLLDEYLHSAGAGAVEGAFVGMGSIPGGRALAVTSGDDGLRFLVLGPGFAVENGVLSGLPPEIVRQPTGGQVPWGEPLVLRADIAGSGDLHYTWYRDGVTVGTGSQFSVPSARFEDAGSYRVRVSNSLGQVTTGTFEVVVGRSTSPAFQPGNLLVSGGSSILEYTADGELVQSVPIPHPDFATAGAKGIAVDHFGRVWLLDDIRSSHVYLSVFTPEAGQWEHHATPSPVRLGSLAIIGDTIYTATAAHDLRTGALLGDWQPASPAAGISAGHDGRLYARDDTRVIELDPATGAVRRSVELGDRVEALAADAAGAFFIARQGVLHHLSPAGDPLDSLDFNPLFDTGNPFDPNSMGALGTIALSRSGELALPTSRSWVLRGGTPFGAPSRFRAGGRDYAAWVPHFVTFDTEPPPGIHREDTPFRYTVRFVTTGGDPPLTLAAELPEWLSFTPHGDGTATVAGTPATDAEAGQHVVALTASAPGAPPSEQRFLIEVEAVNDAPAITGPTAFTLAEDQEPVSIELSALFADEEDGLLAFALADTDGGAGRAGFAIEGTRLTVSPLPDANGTATATVSARDSGGLEGSAQLAFEIAPVPDAPTATAPPAVDAGAAAAPMVLAMAPQFSDADQGDTLTFTLGGNTNPGIFEHLAIDAVTGDLSITFAPYLSGAATVTVRATDRDGLSAETTVDISLPEIPEPVSAAAPPAVNRQTGLVEQALTITNNGARAIGGFRVEIGDLPPGLSLHNGSGQPAAGMWEIGYGRPVAAGESVTVWLEYYSAERVAAGAGSLLVEQRLPGDPQPAPGATPPPAVDRVLHLPDGAILIEFAAEPGERYRIQYRDGGSPWLESSAPIRAGGSRVQWIDRGPPKTTAHPSEVGGRLYRVVRE